MAPQPRDTMPQDLENDQLKCLKRAVLLNLLYESTYLICEIAKTRLRPDHILAEQTALIYGRVR